ncbi:hypothetical protein FACS1894186_3190 [Alphaproteobacteria bacterium]|nr:hypothetical protein FACS1894186_3190 [Alphaproteobacteria bacterium]
METETNINQEPETAAPAEAAPMPAYDIRVDSDLLGVDPEVNSRLAKAGFTAQQAQLVYDLAIEKIVPAIRQLASQMAAASDIARLVAHFGSEERFAAVARQLSAWGEKHLPPKALAAMASSYEGVLALHRMMEGRQSVIGAPEASANGASTTEADLKRLMATPAYWRDHDPRTVARVEEGFSRLYPDAR